MAFFFSSFVGLGGAGASCSDEEQAQQSNREVANTEVGCKPFGSKPSFGSKLYENNPLTSDSSAISNSCFAGFSRDSDQKFVSKFDDDTAGFTGLTDAGSSGSSGLDGLGDTLNDGTKHAKNVRNEWNSYDAKTQCCITPSDNIKQIFTSLKVGQTVSFKLRKWTYQATKMDANTVKQQNLSTKKQRVFTITKDDNHVPFAPTARNRAMTHNKSSHASSKNGATIWHFYDKTSKKDVFCSGVISSRLTEMKSGDTIEYKIGKWDYTATKVNNSSVKQLNKSTGTVRIFGNTPLASGGNIKAPKAQKTPSFEFEKSLFRVSMDAKKYEIIRVEKCTFGGNGAMRRKCYSAIKKGLEKKYRREKRLLGDLEQLLFHGTDWDTVEKIEKNGFNRDFNKRSKYGKGVYFAKCAKYSDKYTKENSAGERCLLLCNVMVGKAGVGKKDITPEEQDKFDCLVDRVEKPKIFVVAKDYHCIPVCRVVYRKLS